MKLRPACERNVNVICGVFELGGKALQYAHLMIPRLRSRKEPRVGLALGGGAARGIAHIGVLKALADEEIPIHAVAGTSAGSLVGALYCAGYTWKDIYDTVRETRWRDLIKPVFPRMGLVKADRLETRLREMVGEAPIEELAIPFAAVAVDVRTGKQVVIDRGPPGPAVRASCSVPGIFEPVWLGDKMLVDGGMANSVPASVVRDMGADIVLAIDLNGDRIEQQEPGNVFGVLFHSFSILFAANAKDAQEHADVLVKPDLAGFSYSNLKVHAQLFERGETAMRDAMAQLKARLRGLRTARA